MDNHSFYLAIDSKFHNLQYVFLKLTLWEKIISTLKLSPGYKVIDELKPINMIYKKNKAIEFEKHGVKMRLYNSKEQCPEAAIVYQETKIGHHEELYHSRSNFLFYIIEGSGTWFIEDKSYSVEAGDVVIIPPNNRFYYKGNLKQICITSPSWEPEHEHHVRNIEF